MNNELLNKKFKVKVGKMYVKNIEINTYCDSYDLSLTLDICESKTFKDLWIIEILSTLLETEICLEYLEIDGDKDV